MRKTIFFLIAAISVAASVSSCSKNDESAGAGTAEEISFGLSGEGFDVDLQTKADVVTSLSNVYWEASSGSSVVHAVAKYDVSSNKVSTGKYWPSDDVTYSYKASNVSFTSGGAITATNATDIVAGTESGVTKSTDCTITLDHIFARTGSVSLTAEDNTYTVSDVSWTIQSNDGKSGTAGTYTIGSGWGATATAALDQQALTGSSDLYIIPASYTVGVTFTLTKGAYSETFTKSAALTFVQGKVNNIAGKVSSTIGGAKQIEFSVTVTPWGSTDLTPTFE